MASREENQKKLNEIKEFIVSNREFLKPLFGFLYWQFSQIEESCHYNPDEALQEATSVNLSHEDDELIAAFIASYLELWQGARDLGAASRFIADTLAMTANELIEARAVWRGSQDSFRVDP